MISPGTDGKQIKMVLLFFNCYFSISTTESSEHPEGTGVGLTVIDFFFSSSLS